MMYTFPTRAKRTRKPLPYRIPRQPTPPEQIGLIQGITPDSIQEWWTALWLNAHKFTYTYQYFVPGGKGGYRVDFVIDTVPLLTMIELNGAHWHYGELGLDDRQRQIDIETYMLAVAKIPIRFLWASDMLTRETVEAALEKIMRIE